MVGGCVFIRILLSGKNGSKEQLIVMDQKKYDVHYWKGLGIKRSGI